MAFDLATYAVKLREYGFAPIALHRPVLDDEGKVVGCNCVPYPAGRVCPPKSWGKHPVNGRWQERTELFLDSEQVRVEFSTRQYGAPDVNIGCATGPVSGLIIIDIDVGDGKPGLQELHMLEERLGALPVTVRVVTGSGGLHLYLRHPVGVVIQNSASTVAPGVDIRAKGGQGVLPPSLHKSGKLYRWAPGRGPWQVAIAELPPAWVELLASKRREPPPTAARRSRPARRSVPMPEMTYDQARAVLATMLQHPLMVWADEHPNDVSREVWRGIATNLAISALDQDQLENTARAAFHSISRKYSDYSDYETDKTFDDALDSASTHGPITFGHMRGHGAPDEACESRGGSSLVHAARLTLINRKSP
jgi:hypothetical protein